MLKKSKSLVISMMLVAAMVLGTAACGNKNNAPATETAAVETVTETAAESTSETVEETTSETTAETVVGEGAVSFNFTVVDADKNETAFNVHTDAATVGEALSELGLIEGEESEYGLYVKTVNGVTADYDVDGTYWAFYVNGEMASVGVDSTDVEEGATYSFEVAK